MLRAFVHAAGTSYENRNMKIHSTPYACYVSLRNGLTLELTFEAPPRQYSSHSTPRPWQDQTFRSSGVWMFHEEVLFEARVGLA
jgi:hypothetical protein